jgi:hypothetical protein
MPRNSAAGRALERDPSSYVDALFGMTVDYISEHKVGLLTTLMDMNSHPRSEYFYDIERLVSLADYSWTC